MRLFVGSKANTRVSDIFFIPQRPMQSKDITVVIEKVQRLVESLETHEVWQAPHLFSFFFPKWIIRIRDQAPREFCLCLLGNWRFISFYLLPSGSPNLNKHQFIHLSEFLNPNSRTPICKFFYRCFCKFCKGFEEELPWFLAPGFLLVHQETEAHPHTSISKWSWIIKDDCHAKIFKTNFLKLWFLEFCVFLWMQGKGRLESLSFL